MLVPILQASGSSLLVSNPNLTSPDLLTSRASLSGGPKVDLRARPYLQMENLILEDDRVG